MQVVQNTLNTHLEVPDVTEDRSLGMVIYVCDSSLERLQEERVNSKSPRVALEDSLGS